jgi:polar amino acid transport system ATP-binding protein
MRNPTGDRTTAGAPAGGNERPPAAEATAALLRVRGLAKSFGGQEVLRGIDLDVMPADRIAILGASGSGKSTLLRCLNFMERPSAGTVELGGHAIGRPAPARDEPGRRVYDEGELTRVRQRVGMVFQQFNLFPHMTALGNVMEGLRTVRGQREAQARARAERELARVGLADKADAYPARLSGGQKQRVAIARALAMDPEILLFDEPTSALDPELVGEVLRVIRSLAEEGRTMLLVTHELGFAYHVANRVLFIAEGSIHEQGPPDRILRHPTQPRTQAFLQRHREFDF